MPPGTTEPTEKFTLERDYITSALQFLITPEQGKMCNKGQRGPASGTLVFSTASTAR